MLKLIKKHKILTLSAILLAWLFYHNTVKAHIAVNSLGQNMLMFISLVIPIFIGIKILEVWIPDNFLTKHFTNNTFKGYLSVLIAGSISVGPLYIAFPICMTLLEKGANISYVIFLLGVWSSTKLPLLIFEYSTLGLKFTTLHVGVSLTSYLLISIFLGKVISKRKDNAENAQQV